MFSVIQIIGVVNVDFLINLNMILSPAALIETYVLLTLFHYPINSLLLSLFYYVK